MIKTCEILLLGFTDDFNQKIRDLKRKFPDLQDYFEVIRNIIYLDSND
jgi:hypothetical protein